jgi:hypothetical protein
LLARLWTDRVPPAKTADGQVAHGGVILEISPAFKHWAILAGPGPRWDCEMVTVMTGK